MMMIVENIADLLYRYDCVIVPNFGGFICSEDSAALDKVTHTFTPPTKRISFNKYLNKNDGLLANYMAKQEGISYEEAMSKIQQIVEDWNTSLAKNSLKLDGIGTFHLDQNENLVFEASNDINYLRASFGLTTIVSPPIKREKAILKKKVVTPKPVSKPKPEPKKEKVIPIAEKSESKFPVFIKYAAGVAIAISLYGAGNYIYNQNEQEQEFVSSKVAQENVEKQIQEATFVVGNPLPAITLTVGLTPEKKELNYHIIAGSFREMKNAEKKIKELEAKGYKAKVIGKNKWDLIQVAYESFHTREDAIVVLEKIKAELAKDAWLLTKKI
ncbi:HU domain-containing protein [Aureivirga marina]|uniref:HU domain-containing protein n=1 Tax=Aureivirga marina TaxID=1182451 RepID=UPI0018CA5D25|nr:SPOR domain-containing protein [Aureivirga marina]